jgi:hypothetical protein
LKLKNELRIMDKDIKEMTEKELETLKNLYNKFSAKCEKICEQLDRLHGGYGHSDEFIPMGDDVYGHGHEYWSYGGHEEHEKYFPTILLTYTEEELKTFVDAHLTFAKREREKKERLEKEKKEKEEMAEYQRLKEKFEKSV